MSNYMKLFKGLDHAKAYARFRPVYTPELYEQIIQFMQQGDNRQKYNLAVDVGCGSGQSTKPLAQYFKQIIGLDPSTDQIEEGIKATSKESNITLQVGVAEEMPCDDNSVDLVSCGQSFHWLNEGKFYNEVDRVLKPGTGCLAIYGYGNSSITNNDRAMQVVQHFYRVTLDGYWSDRRQMIDNLYRSVVLLYKDYVRIDSLDIHGSMALSDYIGYISSWSGYRGFLKKNPYDPLPEVKAKMLEAFQPMSLEDAFIEYTFPVFLLMGRKPIAK